MAHRAHKAVHRAAKHRPSTLAKVGALLAAPIPDVELLLAAMANPDSGIKFVLGIARKAGRRISEVQSVIFDKLKWTADAAKGWLRDHGFTETAKDEGATFWRFRQQSPGKYREFRTIVPGMQNPSLGRRLRPGDVILGGYELGPDLTPIRKPLPPRIPGKDYGSDPLGGGKFRMVPSGDIVDFDERNRRLSNPDRPTEKYVYQMDPGGRWEFFLTLYPMGHPAWNEGHSREWKQYHELAKKFPEKWDVSWVPPGFRNPDVSESISSYQEHLETTTSPEFRAATPGEQAAAMTAQDLCEAYENPAPDWPEEWKAKVEALLKDWHETGRGFFERHYANLNYDSYRPKTVKYKRLWAMLDEGTAGAFMLNRETGNIYRIKSAYGVPNYKKLIGHISNVTGQDLLIRRWNPEGSLGSGARFQALESKLASRPDVEDPRALAAWIGRQKYGTKRFQRIATKARRAGNPKTTAPAFDVSDVPLSSIKRGDFIQAIFDDTERMWIKVSKVGRSAVTGKLDNIPVAVRMKLGQKVAVPFGHIIDVAHENPYPRQRNPESAAAELYEEFHGKPPGETLEIVTDKLEHEWLTQLGLLVELKVATLTNLEATIRFDKGAPNLCSSEDGKQLYFEGGDQSLDLKALKMDGEKWLKDSMVIGVLTSLVYETEKGFHNFKLTHYEHNLGEESGHQPFLIYDPNNKLLSISGGQYLTKSEGIIN